jgi:hypothetical protein
VARRVALLLILCVVASARPAGPGLSFDNGVPPDLRTLAAGTWERFLAAFPEQRDCIAPVAVDARWSFEDRAAYDPENHVVIVRIPATAPHLEAALVHEFAHHLEFTCPAQRNLRPAFLAAQGFRENASWWNGATWETTPSEQFAEAATVVVLRRRPGHMRIHVTPEALTALRDWALNHRS